MTFDQRKSRLKINYKNIDIGGIIYSTVKINNFDPSLILAVSLNPNYAGKCAQDACAARSVFEQVKKRDLPLFMNELVFEEYRSLFGSSFFDYKVGDLQIETKRWRKRKKLDVIFRDVVSKIDSLSLSSDRIVLVSSQDEIKYLGDYAGKNFGLGGEVFYRKE